MLKLSSFVKYLRPFVLLIFFTTSVVAQTETWTQRSSLGFDVPSRSYAGMTALNGKLYMAGGYSGGSSGNQKDVIEYDPQAKVFRKLKDLNQGGMGTLLFTAGDQLFAYDAGSWKKYDFQNDNWLAQGHAPIVPGTGFVSNDTIFLMGKGLSFTQVYSYNLVTGKWTRRSDYPGSAKDGAMAFSIGSKGYFGGGSSANGLSRAFYEYDPATDIWTAKAPIPENLGGLVGVSVNGKAYAGLGGNPDPSDSWYEYDPIADSWSLKAAGMAVFYSCAAVIDHDVYVFGGNINNRPDISVSAIRKYNCENNEWTFQERVSGGNRIRAVGFYANNKIYIGGGHDGQSLTDFWEYDISTDTWSPKASFGSGFANRAAAGMDGKGYFIGGYNKNALPPQYSDSLLVFDPVTDTWTALANYPGGKRWGMAAFAIDGKLYAGMGSNNTGSSSAFYVYDPSGDDWTRLANSPGIGVVYSSFAIADTGYILMANGSWQLDLYAYDINSDSWIDKQVSVANGASQIPEGSVNHAFSWNNKGYLFMVGGIVHEYNPASNSWRRLTPFPQGARIHSAVIATPEGAFVGFGNTTASGDDFSVRNDLWRLDLQAGVSTRVGDFNSCLSVPYPIPHTVADNEGQLFAFGPDGCIAVRSSDTLIPYREMHYWLGSSSKEYGMYLNKNISYTKLGPVQNGKMRLYFTNRELARFVSEFNQKYHTSYTTTDISIVRYSGSTSDLDPENNTDEQNFYSKIASSLTNYGPEGQFSYFEFETDRAGEFYAVLSTPDVVTGISNSSKAGIAVYPNPADQVIQISMYSVEMGPAELFIQTVDGKVVARESFALHKGENTPQVNVSGLDKGIYIISVQTGDKKLLTKFVK